jgi:hypothetical protein
MGLPKTQRQVAQVDLHQSCLVNHNLVPGIIVDHQQVAIGMVCVQPIESVESIIRMYPALKMATVREKRSVVLEQETECVARRTFRRQAHVRMSLR